MDTKLRHMRDLKLYWTNVAESLMQPLPIVEHLDELKHLRLSFFSRVVLPLMYQLIFERTEEALHDGIVVTVSLATHTHHYPGGGQQLPIGHTGIQCPLIGVMDQTTM